MKKIKLYLCIDTYSKEEIIEYILSLEKGSKLYSSDLVIKFNLDFDEAESILLELEEKSLIHK